MTILDTYKYSLKSSRFFYNPSYAWEHIGYWGSDEFTSEDSDLVLMVQDDAVLCQALEIRKWKDVAWVGAPWIPRQGPKAWHFYWAMPRNWERFHNTAGDIPDYPTADQICEDARVGSHGNGGLSLRRRSWIRKVISSWPTSIQEHSGLSRKQWQNMTCQANEIAVEDVYYVTIWELPFLLYWKRPCLLGILQHYEVENRTEWVETMVRSRWFTIDGNTKALERVRRAIRDGSPIVPIGIHKPWGEFFRDQYMCHPQVHQQCQYLQTIIAKWNCCDKAYPSKSVCEVKCPTMNTQFLL